MPANIIERKVKKREREKYSDIFLTIQLLLIFIASCNIMQILSQRTFFVKAAFHRNNSTQF